MTAQITRDGAGDLVLLNVGTGGEPGVIPDVDALRHQAGLGMRLAEKAREFHRINEKVYVERLTPGEHTRFLLLPKEMGTIAAEILAEKEKQ